MRLLQGQADDDSTAVAVAVRAMSEVDRKRNVTGMQFGANLFKHRHVFFVRFMTVTLDAAAGLVQVCVDAKFARVLHDLSHSPGRYSHLFVLSKLLSMKLLYSQKARLSTKMIDNLLSP